MKRIATFLLIMVLVMAIVCEYDNIANNDHIFLRLRFTGDRLVVESQETAHELGNRFEGKLQNP